MKELVQLQKQIVPDLLELMEQRYVILKNVYTLQPIGRRALAESCGLSERQVRGEINFLHEQSLLKVTKKGMFITNKGTLLLDKMSEFMKMLEGLSVLEKRIGEILSIEKVVVVPGDSDQDDSVKLEMGKACVDFLKQVIQKDNIIAVTGGTTMASVAEMMSPLNKENNYLFIPARGGSGERMESQANTIVSEMAGKTDGDYRLFHAPEILSDTAYESLLREPAIQEMLQLIKRSNIVIHGVGDALKMAKRRNSTEETIEKLKNKQAVGEAFGFYFNGYGETVHKLKTLGIHLEDLAAVDYVVAVAGGKSKASAITSYAKQKKSNVLITDRAAAEEILKGKRI